MKNKTGKRVAASSAQRSVSNCITTKIHGKLLLLFLLSFAVKNIQAQANGDSLKAYFEKKTERIESDSKKEINHSFKITISKSKKFKDAKIEFSVESTGMDPVQVFLPSDRTLKAEETKDVTKEFEIKFSRDDKDDKILKLKLTATGSDGKPVLLNDTNLTHMVYIKPLLDTLSDAFKSGHELWLFTGTNLDFIDGPKLKELYFKINYLVNIKNHGRSTKSWFQLITGKNRYFSDRDSLTRISFSDIVLKATPGDSITTATGYYNSFRQTVTDNYFASFKYLYNIQCLSSDKSKIFATAGFYFALQTLKTTYTNHDIISDTITKLRNPDSTYTFRPLLNENKIKQFNSNLSIGLTHILTTSKINVKSFLDVGLNMFNYPYSIVRNSLNEFTSYKSDKRLYVQLGIEGTVLTSGISIGAESFIRAGDVPLFNVHFTKVIELEQIGNLFGTLSTGTK